MDPVKKSPRGGGKDVKVRPAAQLNMRSRRRQRKGIERRCGGRGEWG